MSLSAFAFAVLLLLLTPGSTNTLLALSGATRGFKASLPLIGAECAGYLTAIVPLVVLAAPLLIDQPAAALGIKLASTLWVLLLAARLWIRPPSANAQAGTTVAAVYATTVLNPKALIPAAGHPPLLFGRVTSSCLVAFALSLAGRAIGWI